MPHNAAEKRECVMNSFENTVLKYFAEISQIPHGSGNTDEICGYCVSFAEAHGLECVRDEYNNIIIYKEASDGCEGAPPVIIQGHLDMVCEKDADCAIDFEHDGLDLCRDGDFLYARGTTLGGDDGIAVAYALAILADDDIPHPPLEAVFTSDEETGMTGALGLDFSKLKGRTVLNLDSEDEGIFTVGCAGGKTDVQTLPIERENFSGQSFEVSVSGLSGGHSGVEIGCGRANAITAAARILRFLCRDFDLRLIEFCGGTKDNAIPVSAVFSAAVCPEKIDEVKDAAERLGEKLRCEFSATDPKLEICFSEGESGKFRVFSSESLSSALLLLRLNQNGVISMSRDIEGFVQTSANLAIAVCCEESLQLHISHRSMSSFELEDCADKTSALCEALGGSVHVCGAYPPWEPNKNSEISALCGAEYRRMFGKEPTVSAIHAGLECGIFSAHTGNILDCISFGPNIFDIHTTKERISISSAKRVFDFIKEVLRVLSEKKYF